MFWGIFKFFNTGIILKLNFILPVKKKINFIFNMVKRISEQRRIEREKLCVGWWRKKIMENMSDSEKEKQSRSINVSSSKVCKRCKQMFEPASNTPTSCRFHTSFFVCRRHDDQKRYPPLTLFHLYPFLFAFVISNLQISATTEGTFKFCCNINNNNTLALPICTKKDQISQFAKSTGFSLILSSVR